ncbi:trypsin-like serine protease [Streptomyces yaizuensis]|uniref:Trypsin-like serine protease n=1 Tax=Streptomyces yaizuensis TaxID=2989713 RepID=A0ABQ5NX06_9ACTN|nr:trypsin-like serine protease [Streptomyces sp. YSPA8]GLF94673.1 trypsin-like serine protease [Streptomyces sp. YSPA8]
MPHSIRTRRIGKGIPAVATVLALASTGLLAGQAGAAPAAPLPAERQSVTPQGELHERVADALKSIRAQGATAQIRPTPGDDRRAASAPSARIIGGKTTAIATAPWMAQLYFNDRYGDLYSCGGAVVAPTKIVTAAHCVDGIAWKTAGAVVTGADRTPTLTGRVDQAGRPILNLRGGELRGVARQWQHAKYDDYSLNNDVAVLTLEAPVKAKPLPVMRPTDTGLYKAGTDGKVYGWGLTGSGANARGSEMLKVADADAQSDTNCRKAYGSDFIAGTMYCAGRAPTGKDSTSETTCNGDSGGPLVAGGRLVGIVSWGDRNCSARGKYGVYAKVSAFQAAFRHQIHDTNWSGDRYADLVARRGDNLFSWFSTGKTLVRKSDQGDYRGVDILVQTDLDRDNRQDLVYRVPDGSVRWKRGGGTATTIMQDWRSQRQILAPGDLSGDEIPDLMTVTDKGNAYVHVGTGRGTFGAPVLVGPGWGQFDMVRGHGDFSGDGRADVLARGAGGKTYLYQGTGSATKPFLGKLQVATFNNLNALITTGDMNGDGHADLLGRDTAHRMWLYPGTGRASKPFGSRVQFGSGWNNYNLFG